MTTEGPAREYNEEISALREEIENKTGKTPEQLYEEREKRVRDAIELKEPDRVPLWIIPEPGRYCGLPQSAAYYEPVAWKVAIRNAILDFEPDLALSGFGTSGLSWEALDVKNRLWPGGPLPPDYEYAEDFYLASDVTLARPKHPDYPEISDAISDRFTEIISCQKSATDGLGDLQQDIIDILTPVPEVVLPTWAIVLIVVAVVAVVIVIIVIWKKRT